MTPREIRFGLDGLTMLVVGTVAATLAQLTWRLTGEANGASPIAAAMDAYVAPAPAPDLATLVTLPPFGTAAVATVAVSAPAPTDLVLRGVLLANPSSASSALIAAAGAEPVAYRIGEAIGGGVTLERMGVDYVILGSGGGSATLYFPGDDRARQPMTFAPSGAGSTPIATGVAVSGIAPPPAPPPPGSATAQSLIDRLGATLTPRGYQVGPSLSPQLRGAGLRAGDVVAAVNGVDPQSFAADPVRVAQAVAAGQAQVEVLREGTRIALSVSLR